MNACAMLPPAIANGILQRAVYWPVSALRDRRDYLAWDRGIGCNSARIAGTRHVFQGRSIRT